MMNYILHNHEDKLFYKNNLYLRTINFQHQHIQ